MTRTRTVMNCLLALVVIACCALPALAQDGSNAPRQPVVKNMTSAWVGYASMFLVMTLVVMVSLYPSKRGHQE